MGNVSLALVLLSGLFGADPALGGCELWQEVVTHLDPVGEWACVQQHNALGSDTALRKPTLVNTHTGARRETAACTKTPNGRELVPIWPKAVGDKRAVRGVIELQAEPEPVVIVGPERHRLNGKAGRRLAALSDILASCRGCQAAGWTVGTSPERSLAALSYPVNNDCDGLVRRVELFRVGW